MAVGVGALAQVPTYIGRGSAVRRVAGFDATVINGSGGGGGDGVAIPDERILTNWSNAGVGGRYRWSRPDLILTNVTGLATEGSTNVAAAIQAIINAAPVNPATNLVIYFPPGIYCLSNSISVKSYVTLRGSRTNAAGTVTPYATNTVFRVQHSELQAIDYTGGLGFVPKLSIVSGATKGSTNLTFASAPTMEPNSMVFITQTNDLAGGVTSDGWESATVSPCNYCSIDGTDYIWSQGQAIEVLSVAGSSITFRPPLYFTATNNPSAYYAVPVGTVSGDNHIEYVGLENFHLSIAPGYVPVHGVSLDKTADSWIRGVRLSGAADKALFKSVRSTRFTFTNNVVVDNPGLGAASGGGVVLFPASFDYLVSDNVFDAVREPISITGPNSGVISYNYITNCPNVNSNFLVAAINFHGAYPFFVLVEGNVVTKIHADLIHGSAGWITLLRNLIFGRQPTTGGITNDSGQGAIWVDCTNWYFTVAANMLGYSGAASDVSSYTNEVFSPTVESDGDAFNNVLVNAKGPAWTIRYGYSGFLTNRGPDPVIRSTMLHVGTWSYYTNATLYATNATIQSSLYLAGDPAWFGILIFPPFGPERSGQNFTFASAALAIPAGYRWNNNGANP
jgi:hypothetical protein